MKRERARIPDWALVIIALLVAAALVIAVFSVIFLVVLDTEPETKAFSGPSSPYVARITIAGEISGSANRFSSSDVAYHHIWTMETIDTLIGDSDNKGICLWLETPGGAVYESDELYLKLMEYKEKTGRPIYAYMRKIAASGGYYAAAATDEIYANRNTWTGSIGVTIGTLFDVSGFLESHGVSTETITSGRNKAMGSYYEPLTDEQREIFQSLVDDAYDRFVSIVALGRGMTEKEVRIVADGRILTAQQALDAGLIDGILGEKEAEDAIKAKFDEGTIMHDCYFKPDSGYLSLFASVLGGRQGFLENILSGFGGSLYKGDVAAVLDLAREQAENDIPPIKYLYTG